jgi:hypothetical protein
MNKQQAHTLKLKIALFAEKSAMLEHAKNKQSSLDVALSERDRAREEVYKLLDSLVTEK